MKQVISLIIILLICITYPLNTLSAPCVSVFGGIAPGINPELSEVLMLRDLLHNSREASLLSKEALNKRLRYIWLLSFYVRGEAYIMAIDILSKELTHSIYPTEIRAIQQAIEDMEQARYLREYRNERGVK